MGNGKLSLFWTWWVTEISALVPNWFSAVFLALPQVKPLRFHSEAQRITRRKGGILAPLRLLTENLPSAKKSRHQVVDVHFPVAQCLSREITLPPVRGRALDNALSLDTLRRTPFAENEIGWSYRVSERRADGVTVVQWIAKSADLQVLRDRLARHGIAVGRILVDGHTQGRPLADFSQAVRARSRPWRWLNAALLLGFAGVVGYGVAQPVLADRAAVQQLEGRIQTLRSRAVMLRQDVEAFRAEQSQKTAFLDQIRTRPLLINALRELTVSLPDTAWIADVVYRPPQITVAGTVAGSAAELVLELAEGKHLGNPTMAGPVSRGSGQSERFEIAFTIGGGE